MIEINFATTHSALARIQRQFDRVRLGIPPVILLTIAICSASIVIGAIYLIGTQRALASIQAKQRAQAPIVARLKREQKLLSAAISETLATDAAERANGTIAYTLATELARMPRNATITTLSAGKSGTTSVSGNAASSAVSFAIASILSPGAAISISNCEGLCERGRHRAYAITKPDDISTQAPTSTAAGPALSTPSPQQPSATP